MFTVAIIGPDGAGKSTVIEGLRHTFPYPMRHIYMGVNPDSLTHMLPTTRLINYLKRRQPNGTVGQSATEIISFGQEYRQDKKRGWKWLLHQTKTFLFITNRIGEEWYRQVVCWYYLQRGYIVVFDRHFYLDYLAFDFTYPDTEQPLLRRIHDTLIKKTYPRPNLTIYLDAPADVLYARKGESTIETLQQKREAYLSIRQFVPTFHVVDTTQSLEDMLETVSNHIKSYQEARG